MAALNRRQIEQFVGTPDIGVVEESIASMRNNASVDPLQLGLKMLEGAKSDFHAVGAHYGSSSKSATQGMGFSDAIPQKYGSGTVGQNMAGKMSVSPGANNYAAAAAFALTGENQYLQGAKYDSAAVGVALDILRRDPFNKEAEAAVKSHQFISQFDPTSSFAEQAVGIAMKIGASAMPGGSFVTTASSMAQYSGLFGGNTEGPDYKALALGGGRLNPNSSDYDPALTAEQFLTNQPSTAVAEETEETAGRGSSVTSEELNERKKARSQTGELVNTPGGPEARQDTAFASDVGVVGDTDYYDENRAYSDRDVDFATLVGRQLGELQAGEKAEGGLLASRLTTDAEWARYQTALDAARAAQPQPSKARRPRPVSANPAPVKEDPGVQEQAQETVTSIGLQTGRAATILSDEDSDYETLVGGGTYQRGSRRNL